MAVPTIVHFEIPANDLDSLSRFYAEVFGWEFTKTEMPGMDYRRIRTGPEGKSVGGGMYPRMGPDDRPRNFVWVEEIDPAIARFKAAGGSEIVGKMEVPGMGWSFIGADPEGNPIALWQPAMRRPTRRRPATARRKR